MSKLFKRISSIGVAAALATTMAVSASAEYNSKYINGYLASASVTANKNTKTQTAYTFYSNKQARVFVGMAVANALTGSTLAEVPRTERAANDYYVYANTAVKSSPITVFSAHEVVPVTGDDDPWAIYQEEYYVVQ